MSDESALKRLPPVLKLLLTGYVLSAFGDGIYLIAVNWWVVTSTGSATALGIVAASGAVVFLVCAPLAGRLVDRFGALRLLVFADAWRIVVLSVFLILGLLGLDARGLSFFLPLIILMTLGTSVSQPGVFVLIPQIVNAEQVRQSNALLVTSRSVATFAGPASAGVLLGLGSVEWAIGVNILSFVVSLVVLATIHRKIPGVANRPKSHAEIAPRWLVLKAILNKRSTMFAFGVALIGNLALSMYLLTLPLRFEEGRVGEMPGATAYGLTSASFQLGMILAGIGLAGSRANRIRTTSTTVGLGLGAMALALVALGAVETAPLLFLSAFVLGAGLMFVSVLSDTQLQLAIPDNVRGRVQGAVQGLGSGLRPLGILLATALYGLSGAQLSLSVAGALIGLMVILVVALDGYSDAVNAERIDQKQTAQV